VFISLDLHMIDLPPIAPVLSKIRGFFFSRHISSLSPNQMTSSAIVSGSSAALIPALSAQ
jgi:hypothetical protein